MAAEMLPKGSAETRMIRACRETLAIFFALPREERKLIPSSLIAALRNCAGLRKGEKVRPAGELGKTSWLVNMLLSLFLYYSGENSKRELMDVIRDGSMQDRQIVRYVLTVKNRIESGA